MHYLQLFFILYGILAIGHILIQMLFAHLEHRRQAGIIATSSQRSVAVVVPIYNEDPYLLEQCLLSIINQKDIGRLGIFAVNDGSRNEKAIRRLMNHYPGITYINLPHNVGKRAAQVEAFDAIGHEYDIIVTVDSDTVLSNSHDIVAGLRRFDDVKIGAVCGDVAVINHSTNILTRLIDLRYWMAFNQERAAQSYFGAVLCCSGPFSLYRTEIIQRVKNRYINQWFLGKRCTYGDDRHLTNLVLSDGHRVVFEERAHALTHAPESLSGYVKQQVRWNKSFYREILWTLPLLKRHSLYMAYDLACQFILPFLLIVALIATFVQAFTVNPWILALYAATILAIALLRVIYAIGRTRRLGFLLFTLYGFMHIGLLIPVRMYALATMRRTKWGTR